MYVSPDQYLTFIDKISDLTIKNQDFKNDNKVLKYEVKKQKQLLHQYDVQNGYSRNPFQPVFNQTPQQIPQVAPQAAHVEKTPVKAYSNKSIDSEANRIPLKQIMNCLNQNEKMMCEKISQLVDKKQNDLLEKIKEIKGKQKQSKKEIKSMESHSSIKSSQYKDFMNQMKGLYKAFNKNIEDPSNTQLLTWVNELKEKQRKLYDLKVEMARLDLEKQSSKRIQEPVINVKPPKSQKPAKSQKPKLQKQSILKRDSKILQKSKTQNKPTPNQGKRQSKVKIQEDKHKSASKNLLSPTSMIKKSSTPKSKNRPSISNSKLDLGKSKTTSKIGTSSQKIKSSGKDSRVKQSTSKIKASGKDLKTKSSNKIPKPEKLGTSQRKEEKAEKEVRKSVRKSTKILDKQRSNSKKSAISKIGKSEKKLSKDLTKSQVKDVNKSKKSIKEKDDKKKSVKKIDKTTKSTKSIKSKKQVKNVKETGKKSTNKIKVGEASKRKNSSVSQSRVSENNSVSILDFPKGQKEHQPSRFSREEPQEENLHLKLTQSFLAHD